MKVERWGNLFWIAATIYFGLFVIGQADSLFNGLLPSGHHDVETPAEPFAELHEDDADKAIALGEKVFRNAGCLACHQVGLVGNNVGPSLSNVAQRFTTREALLEKLNDPQSLVPNTIMPSYAHLGDDEKEALVIYLGTLNSEHQGLETGVGDVPEDILAKAAPVNPDTALIERGLDVFLNSGCSACHAIAGVDGAIGALGPNLTREGLRGRTDEWQKEHLKQPLSVYTVGEASGAQLMPNYDSLSDGELDALVAYLQSLR